MSDTLTVRDHSQPCEHGERALEGPDWWGCLVVSCPGGREIVLRLTTLKDHTVHPDDIMYVEVGDE